MSIPNGGTGQREPAQQADENRKVIGEIVYAAAQTALRLTSDVIIYLLTGGRRL